MVYFNHRRRIFRRDRAQLRRHSELSISNCTSGATEGSSQLDQSSPTQKFWGSSPIVAPGQFDGRNGIDECGGIQYQQTAHNKRRVTTHQAIPSTLKPIVVTNSNVCFQQLLDLRIPRLKCCFDRAPLDPPITVESLKELDECHIKDNVRLRHDVNFELDLYLQPNANSRGAIVRQNQIRLYWDAVRAELDLYNFLLRHPLARCMKSTTQWKSAFRLPSQASRLRRIVSTIGELVQVVTITADERIFHLKNILDQDFVMQQLEHGQLDFNQLSTGLAELFKGHCAPMRDAHIDYWLRGARNAAASSDPLATLTTLRGIFGILEVMRLDIANHCLRLLRPSFIQDAVSQEMLHFGNEIAKGRFNPEPSCQWFEEQKLSYDKSVKSQAITGISESHRIFMNGFIKLLFPPHSSKTLPPSFVLDEHRISSLRHEILDIIYLDICRRAFCILKLSMAEGCPQAVKPHANIDIWSLVRDIIDEVRIKDKTTRTNWCGMVENITVELVRHTSIVESRHLFFEPTFIWLRKNLQPESEMFSACAANLQHNMKESVLAQIELHLKSSPLELQKAFVPARSAPPRRGRSSYTSVIEKRMAHIALLHWQVWGPLVYNDNTFASKQGPWPNYARPHAFERTSEEHICPARGELAMEDDVDEVVELEGCS